MNDGIGFFQLAMAQGRIAQAWAFLSMRIIFLNRLFYPDQSATGQLLSDLAFYLAAQGSSVHVIASRDLYDNARAALPMRTTINGVKVHRVWTSRFRRSGLIGRVLDSIAFYSSSSLKLLGLARRGDIVIAKTDPPMLSVVTSVLGTVVGFKSVNWLHDIYPEIAAELGIGALAGSFGAGLTEVRNRSLRRAVINVAISDEMAERIRKLDGRRGRVRVIPNWSDDDAILPTGGARHPLREKWLLEGQFVVGYSGNLGRAHEFDTLLQAAELLKDSSRISFLFIGGGHYFSDVETIAKDKGLRNIVFKPPQPRESLSLSLSVADVHWISLRPELTGLIFPSKFYGIAAAGRPMIALTALNGELAQLIERYQCGLVIAPGDSNALARAITDLSENPEKCAQMGINARRMLDQNYTRAQAFRRWSELIDEVAKAGKAGLAG